MSLKVVKYAIVFSNVTLVSKSFLLLNKTIKVSAQKQHDKIKHKGLQIVLIQK